MSKFKTLLCSLCSLVFSIPALAHPPKIWIERPQGAFERPYVTNGVVADRLGIFGFYDTRKMVADNPEALSHAETANSYNNKAHWTYWCGVIPSAFALGWGLGDWADNRTNKGLLIGGSIAVILTSWIDMYFAGKAEYEMLRAINIYNGVPNSPQNVQFISWSRSF